MEEQTPTQAAKKIKLLAKKKYMNELNKNWKDKPLHGKYPERISKPDIDTKTNTYVATRYWTKSRN